MSTSEFEKYLLQTYGPLITISILSSLLKRTPASIRAAIKDEKIQWADPLRRAKRPIGRRVFYLYNAVAEVIQGGAAE
jgi:hypothetical protein